MKILSSPTTSLTIGNVYCNPFRNISSLWAASYSTALPGMIKEGKKKRDIKEEGDRDTGRARCRMMFGCSNKVGNITISASSPKDRHKPISKIAPIYLCETVSSSWWQCKLLGWIIPMSFRGVYQNGSITWGPKFQSALAWADLHKEASVETAEPGTGTDKNTL